ncbi:zonadhesin [Halyomorpha halys]|uniref:zonadhesin n=1 Tax=Halyomorpha halys TaxID=286706 RepID=UPI0006D5265D|nr:uncharacterized protein PB18E9.04c [Halyomorpha halys]
MVPSVLLLLFFHIAGSIGTSAVEEQNKNIQLLQVLLEGLGTPSASNSSLPPRLINTPTPSTDTLPTTIVVTDPEELLEKLVKPSVPNPRSPPSLGMSQVNHKLSVNPLASQTNPQIPSNNPSKPTDLAAATEEFHYELVLPPVSNLHPPQTPVLPPLNSRASLTSSINQSTITGAIDAIVELREGLETQPVLNPGLPAGNGSVSLSPRVPFDSQIPSINPSTTTSVSSEESTEELNKAPFLSSVCLQPFNSGVGVNRQTSSIIPQTPLVNSSTAREVAINPATSIINLQTLPTNQSMKIDTVVASEDLYGLGTPLVSKSHSPPRLDIPPLIPKLSTDPPSLSINPKTVSINQSTTTNVAASAGRLRNRKRGYARHQGYRSGFFRYNTTRSHSTKIKENRGNSTIFPETGTHSRPELPKVSNHSGNTGIHILESGEVSYRGKNSPEGENSYGRYKRGSGRLFDYSGNNSTDGNLVRIKRRSSINIRYNDAFGRHDSASNESGGNRRRSFSRRRKERRGPKQHKEVDMWSQSAE